jgi:D-serine deaminase-like pyridoxal phosphate-dependent protein
MAWEETYLAYSAALREVPRPTAFADLDALEENIQKVLSYSGDRPIRIATKSIRCLPLLKDIQASHGRFIGFMTFSARESLYLSRQGLNDFLIGYPFMQKGEVEAYVELRQQGKRAIAMVDSIEQAEAIHYGLRGTKVEGLVCLDVDVSSDWGWLYFGVRRSPLRWEEQVLALAQSIRRLEHIRIVGVMAYEAQIAGLPDRGLGLKTPIVRFLKRRSWREVQRKRQAIVQALRDAGFELEFVNGGGTGSLPLSAADPSVTEVTAGSAFFAPALFDGYEAVRFRPAAGFSLEITRRPAENIFTCQGGGYVASGAPGPDKLPRPWLPPTARLLPHEGAGEVQTPVYIPNPPAFLRPGEPLYFRHAKAGELCQRFPLLYLVRKDKLTGFYSTYAALPHAWV